MDGGNNSNQNSECDISLSKTSYSKKKKKNGGSVLQKFYLEKMDHSSEWGKIDLENSGFRLDPLSFLIFSSMLD